MEKFEETEWKVDVPLVPPAVLVLKPLARKSGLLHLQLA